jgi:nucleoside-diphosphate-sugar epimerase
MRVLITGATGFIGRHLLTRLIQRGDDVRVLAVPGTTGDLVGVNRTDVILGSLADRALLARACRDRQVVVHLAAKVTGTSAADFRSVNIEGTRNLLDGAKQARVQRFVHMSSTAVYGLTPFPVMWPITEDSPLAAHGSRGVRLYGWSKIESERAVRTAHRAWGLEYVIIRPTVVYGSGAVGARRLLLTLLPTPALMWIEFAPGGVVQWMHVSDLVRLILRAMVHRGAANDVFTAAGPRALTITQLSLELRRALGSIWAAPAALSPRGPTVMVAPFAMTKAAQRLGFSPEVGIREGLREMFGREQAAPPPGFNGGGRDDGAIESDGRV